MATTRVLVDARDLGSSAQRGIGVYLRQVLGALAAREDLQVAALVTDGCVVPPGVDRVGVRRTLGRRLAGVEHDLRLPRDIAHASPEVFWSPAQSPPRAARVPWVQTLHDLTPLVFSHPLLARDARHWRRAAPRLRAATAVITPSRSTARQAVDILGVDPAKVHVVPHGVGPEFRPSGARVQRSRPYVLCVSAWGPHKGFAQASRAIALLAAAGYPHELVVVGPQDTWMRTHLDRDLAQGSRPDRVHVAGYVSDLTAWYRGAAAVLVPSRAEGFGFPVVEAQACGTPVVAADNTSLPEVVGEAGVLAGAGSPAELAAGLRRVFDDAGLRADLVARGLAKATSYDWAASADAHAEILRAAV